MNALHRLVKVTILIGLKAQYHHPAFPSNVSLNVPTLVRSSTLPKVLYRLTQIVLHARWGLFHLRILALTLRYCMVKPWGQGHGRLPFPELLHLFLGFLVLEQEHFMNLRWVKSVGALEDKPCDQYALG